MTPGLSRPHPFPIDLSQPDNSDLQRGRSFLVEALWHYVGSPLVRTELLPFSKLKCFILRLFGAQVGEGVYLKPGIRVKFPWYLSIGDHCWLGERLWIDNLADVTIESHACVSQDVYLCTGNHDWSHPNLRLFRKPIRIGRGSWVSARSMISPGVSIGECGVVVGGSVVSKDVPAYEIHGGNPASFVRLRRIEANPPCGRQEGFVSETPEIHNQATVSA